MTKRSKSALILNANTNIPDNSTRLVSPEDVRDIVKDMIDSTSNLSDGGTVYDALIGYSVILTPTDDRHFTTKKFVEDFIADEEFIKADGSVPLTDNWAIGDHTIIVNSVNAIQNSSNSNNYLQIASGGVVIGSAFRVTIQGDQTVDIQAGNTNRIRIDGSLLNATRVWQFPDEAGIICSRAYAEALVVGLWDDRGNYDASSNLFPSSGGSGSAGVVLKGDIWTVSVAGTLGGNAVTTGDTVRALTDTPGQTSSNWAIAENNIGYVAENSANKDTDGTLSANSDTKYASQKATKTYADTKIAKSPNLTAIDDTGIADNEIAIFDLTNKKIKTSDKVFSTDGTFAGNSDNNIPTEKAAKVYIDSAAFINAIIFG